MTWFAFRGYPPIEVAGIQEKNLVTWGFHGYATQQQAVSHPNSVNILQKAIVNSAEADYKAAKAAGQQPGGPQSNLGKAITDPGGFLAGTAKSELAHGFNWSNWLLRGGEILLGLVLIGVGLAHITGQENTISKAVMKAGVAAAL